MNWDDVKNFLVQVGLPVLANAILPGNGAIITGLAQAIGSTDTTPSTIIKTLQSSQAAVDSAKQFSLQHQEVLIKAAYDYELAQAKLAADDRADARGMAEKADNKTPRNLAYFMTIAFFTALVLLFFLPIPDNNKASVYTMLGSLGTVWLMAMTFYFGTNHQNTVQASIIAQAEPIK